MNIYIYILYIYIYIYIYIYREREREREEREGSELISDVLLWVPIYGRAKAGWPARTYIQQLCEDSGCSPEDLPEAMNDGEEWRERLAARHDDDDNILITVFFLEMLSLTMKFFYI